MYKRQGLLQDLGVFDTVAAFLREPLGGLKEGDKVAKMMPELDDMWEAAFKVGRVSVVVGHVPFVDVGSWMGIRSLTHAPTRRSC